MGNQKNIIEGDFVMIAIERPYAFLFLLLTIPTGWLCFYRIARISGRIKAGKRLSLRLKIRTIFRLLACVSIIFAFAGISWGSRTFPVQKSGDAVSLVFDISYSMTARDAPGGISRLEAAKLYAFNLLKRMEGVPVSVVIAKGDGVIAVPLTDDSAAVEAILSSLSPELMTSAGSSIGKGITAAIKSFPSNMAQASHIWVFTDGDETDNGLASALEDAARFAFPVTLVGFGTAKPVEVTAGDGKTKVKTSLRAGRMIDYAAAASKKAVMPHRKASAYADAITYISADSEGSGWILLKQLAGKAAVSESYDMKSVPRHGIFIFLTIFFLICSFAAGEINTDILSGGKSSIMMVFILSSLFTSCNSGKSTVLNGSFAWYQKKYQNAAANFLRAWTEGQKEQNQKLSDYAAYNLASTYIMQEEYEAALNRLEQVSPEADSKLKSRTYYNMGIIASRTGDYKKAGDFFKFAIIEDGSNIDAKINLEFSQQQLESRQSKSAEKQMSSVQIDKNEASLADAVYTLIQQEEQERWKRLQSNKKNDSTLDY